MPRLIWINPLYFGFFFLILAFIHGSHTYVIEGGSDTVKAVFIFYALSQSFLECLILALAGAGIRESSRGIQQLFVASTLVLLLMHLIDFPLVRLMDLSIWEGLGVVLSETWENFIEMLYATHVTMAVWLSAAAALLLLFLGGLFAFRFSERRLYAISSRAAVSLVLGLPLCMFVCDGFLMGKEPAKFWRARERALPWKRTLASGIQSHLPLAACLKRIPKEPEIHARIQASSIQTEKKPDLFLFIVESLRTDFLTPSIAPAFYSLAQQSSTPAEAVASANGTQLSWFSLFFSRFPLHFAAFQEQGWHSGSPALQLLKKMGYEIEVFSAVRLAYYKMDQLIFGKQLQLADDVHLFPADDLIPAHESDRKTMERLTQRATEEGHQGGRCYIVFLESTHFDYSYPADQTIFTPSNASIDYLGLTLSKESLKSVQNRYKNAVHYLDGLFGTFADALKEKNRWKDAVVVLTGDHGEEFFEEGHLFHASNLNRPQTRVPLLFKLGNNPPEATPLRASHVDIFPTLFHYLLGKEIEIQELFDGESLLTDQKWPFTITGRYNGSRSPYEFCIESAHQKLIAQFTLPHSLYSEQQLRILEVRDALDQPIDWTMESVESEFRAGLDRLFIRASSR